MWLLFETPEYESLVFQAEGDTISQFKTEPVLVANEEFIVSAYEAMSLRDITFITKVEQETGCKVFCNSWIIEAQQTQNSLGSP